MSTTSSIHSSRSRVQHPVDSQEVDGIQESVTMATSILHRVDETLEQFHQQNTRAMPAKSVVLLGLSGVGKTTLIYALAGKQLKVCHDALRARTTLQAVQEMEGFKIGETRTSETTIPRMLVCNDSAGKDKKVSVIDFPGFEDNRGEDREIATAVCMQKVFETSPDMKFLVLIDDKRFTDDRRAEVVKFIRMLETLFAGNKDLISEASSLVVMRSPADRTVGHIRTNIEDIIASDGLDISQRQKDILRSLCRRVVFFRECVKEQHGRLFNTAGMVSDIFEKIRSSSSVKIDAVTLCLTNDAQHKALSVYTTLVGYSTQKIREFAETLTEWVKKYKTNCCSTAEQGDQTARQEALEKLRVVLEKMDAVQTMEVTSAHIGEMISKCRKIVETCGGKSASKLSDDTLSKIELVNCLYRFVQANSPIPFDPVRIIKEKVGECRTVIEGAQSELAAIESRDAAKTSNRRAKKAERECVRLRQEVERVKSENTEKAIFRFLGKCVDASGNFAQAVARLSTDKPEKSKDEASEDKEEAAVSVTVTKE